MHDLERLIAEWRKTAATPGISPETLDELETHVREIVERLVRSGMTVPDAFTRAVVELGHIPKISSEFRKLDEPLWLPVKLAIGATALVVLIVAALVLTRLDSGRSTLLLAAHTFTVTLGYTMTLLIGGLGICFVSQRSFEDFPTSRLHSIARASLVLGIVALFCTTIGVFLGMVWTKIEWGRYWAWDSKEIGGLSTVIWLTCYLIAHRFLRNSARGILAISMVGNVVVSLAWFGPQVNGLHQYGGTPGSFLLALVIIANLAIFAVGWLPAGWLRLRKSL